MSELVNACGVGGGPHGDLAASEWRRQVPVSPPFLWDEAKSLCLLRWKNATRLSSCVYLRVPDDRFGSRGRRVPGGGQNNRRRLSVLRLRHPEGSPLLKRPSAALIRVILAEFSAQRSLREKQFLG